MLEEFSENEAYYLTAKHKEYRINGRKISPFVYAHTSYKIREVSELAAPNGQGQYISLAVYVDSALLCILRVHGEVFNFSASEIERLRSEVTNRFGNRLSIYGLNHCLELIASNAEPMQNVEFYGKPILAITQALGKYINYCKAQFNEFKIGVESEDRPDSGMAASWKDYADAMPPEVAQDFSKLQRKLEVKYGDPDDHKKQFELLKEKAEKQTHDST